MNAVQEYAEGPGWACRAGVHGLQCTACPTLPARPSPDTTSRCGDRDEELVTRAELPETSTSPSACA